MWLARFRLFSFSVVVPFLITYFLGSIWFEAFAFAKNLGPVRAGTISHVSLACSQDTSAKSYVDEREKKRENELGVRSCAELQREKQCCRAD